MPCPALAVALCYLCGLVAAHYLPLPLEALLAGALVCLSLSIVVRRAAPPWLPPVCVCLGLLAAGALWYTIRTHVVPASHISRYGDRDDPVTIEGTVAADPDIRTDYTLVPLQVQRILTEADSIRATGRVLIRLDPRIAPGQAGDRARAAGRLRRPSPARNPGGFDAQAFYTQRGIHGLMSIRQPGGYAVVARQTHPTLHTAIIRPLRRSVERTVDATLQGPSAALLKGILLGHRAQVPEEVLASFTEIGLTHILAVSGLHVGLITLIAVFVFSLLRLPRPFMTGAVLVVLVLYACMTNLTPSVIRASIMAGLFLTGAAMDRQTDAVNILAVAALAILLVWPRAAFDLSFQLSFVATLSILLGYARFRVLLPAALRQSTAWWKRWLVDGFGVSLAAQLGTLPIIASAFFKISLVAPVANLFVGPLVFVATTLGVLAAVAGPFSLDVARLLSAANWLSLQGMIQYASWLAEIPHASIYVPKPSMWFIAAYYVVFLAVLVPPRFLTLRRGIIALLVAGVCGAGWHLGFKPRELIITAIDVGQGDAVLVECPNGYTLLVDGGNRTPEFDTGARVVLPFLRAKGIRRLDAVVVSHPHVDHYGGLAAILDAMPVAEVIDSGLTAGTVRFRRWLDTLTAARTRRRAVSAGDSLRGMGDVRGVVLHPASGFTGGAGVPAEGYNNASVVLRLAYGDFSILLTGDIEIEAEQNLLERRVPLQSTVVKAPHHGSRTSSSLAFMEAVRPRAVVVSVGAWNPFGHPAPQTMARYRQFNAAIYRTDLNGGIVIRSTGRSFYVEPTLRSGAASRLLTPAQALDGICLTRFLRGSILR